VGFLKVLFSKIGMLILAYILIGIAVGPPPGQAGKLPSAALASATGSTIGAWIQFVIWVLAWPLGLVFHHPTFTL
jgi:hypothetical protein